MTRKALFNCNIINEIYHRGAETELIMGGLRRNFNITVSWGLSIRKWGWWAVILFSRRRRFTLALFVKLIITETPRDWSWLGTGHKNYVLTTDDSWISDWWK